MKRLSYIEDARCLKVKPYFDLSSLFEYCVNRETDTKIDFNGHSAETEKLQTDYQRALIPTRDHKTKPHGIFFTP